MHADRTELLRPDPHEFLGQGPGAKDGLVDGLKVLQQGLAGLKVVEEVLAFDQLGVLF